MASGHVIRDLAEWLIVSLVLFALLFEFVLHKLEHWIVGHHPHIQSILRNLYRELMILGIVSFGFILYIFTGDRSEDTKMTFEVAHVFIFLFAVFHTFMVSIAVSISLALSRRWKRLERMDLVKYLEVKDKYRKLTHRRTHRENLLWRHFGWWIFAPNKLFKWRKLHEIMTFHDIRWQFIYYRNLQPDFRFSKLLRKIKFVTFIELVQIHPINWIVLLILVILDIVRTYVIRSYIHRGYGTTKISNFEPLFLISHSLLNMILVTVLSWKITRIYWKLSKNPATYFDTVDPSAIRAEIAIAEEEARILRESLTSGSSSLDDPNASTTKASRFSLPRLLRNSTETNVHQPHQPMYSSMVYNPRQSISEPLDASRHSLDMNKRRGDRERACIEPTGVLFTPYSTEVEQVEPRSHRVGGVAGTLLDVAKRTRDITAERISLEMTAALPTQELDNRAQQPTSWMVLDVEGDTTLNRMSPENRKLRMEAVRRLRDRQRRRSSTIVDTARDLQTAATTTPNRTYPEWVVKLFPRLGRVASAAEKLFWFGSHRFYLFSIENVLFFTNINLSATIAKTAFLVKDRAAHEARKKVVVATSTKLMLSTTVRAVVEDVMTSEMNEEVKCKIRNAVRAAVSNATQTKASNLENNPEESLTLLLVAVGLAVVALVYVLVRIAEIMRKYIFVLNNANLIPENTILQTIHTVKLKDMMNAETMHDGSGEALVVTDSETDDGEGAEMRSNMSSFFQNERNKTQSTNAAVVGEVDA